MDNWYLKTLAYQQEQYPDRQGKKAIKNLQSMQMIDKDLQLTELGKIAKAFYYHPRDIWEWYSQWLENKNPSKLIEGLIYGSAPNYNPDYMPKLPKLLSQLERTVKILNLKLDKPLALSNRNLAALIAARLNTKQHVENCWIKSQLLNDWDRIVSCNKEIEKLIQKRSKYTFLAVYFDETQKDGVHPE